MKNTVILIQFVIISILVFIIIKIYPSSTIDSFKLPLYLDTLKILSKERDSLKTLTEDLLIQRDSILSLPPKIIKYYDYQRTIVHDGTLIQLDSIIRTNTGI